MFTNVHIKKHERGLVFRDGDFLQLLQPGDYRIWNLTGRNSVQVVNTLETAPNGFPPAGGHSPAGGGRGSNGHSNLRANL